MFRLVFSYLLPVFMLLAPLCSQAQGMLDRTVNIDVKKRRVEDVLDIIGKRAHFSFAYNSNIIPRDSLVTLVASSKPVRQLLQQLFADRYQYKEGDGYVVILPAETEKWFIISGYVTDAITGEKIPDVSVIDKHQLSSTLSNHEGFFRLHVKDKGKFAMAEISFSKGGFYRDTMLNLFPGYDQEIAVTLTPNSITMPEVMITQYSGMERSWLGKFLISSKLRQQSANLGKFFVDKPVQASLIPGVGTHGKLSSQVTNTFSFNVLGGYTAGVNGFELGGLFNINKKDARYVQIGGIFNIVNGCVMGAQVGGIFNTVGKSVRGVEIGGISNIVKDSVSGVQVGGLFNSAGGGVRGLQLAGIINLQGKKDSTEKELIDTVYDMKGMQLAGITNTVSKNAKGVQLAGINNIANRNMHGAQLAGIINICRENMQGVQVAGICNIASHMQGTQISLINIADTVDGYSIGLVNIVKKGYHALGVSTNELTDLNLSYKTGTKKLYSIISAGTKFNGDKTDFIYGFGIGSEKRLSNHIGLSAEFTVHDLYNARVDANALLIRIEPVFNWNISRKFTLYTGPSLCLIPYIFVQPGKPAYEVSQTAIYDFNTSYNTASWVGWQVGFHIF